MKGPSVEVSSVRFKIQGADCMDSLRGQSDLLEALCQHYCIAWMSMMLYRAGAQRGNSTTVADRHPWLYCTAAPGTSPTATACLTFSLTAHCYLRVKQHLSGYLPLSQFEAARLGFIRDNLSQEHFLYCTGHKSFHILTLIV